MVNWRLMLSSDCVRLYGGDDHGVRLYGGGDADG